MTCPSKASAIIRIAPPPENRGGGNFVYSALMMAVGMTHVCPHLMAGNYQGEDEGSTGYDHAPKRSQYNSVRVQLFSVLL